ACRRPESRISAAIAFVHAFKRASASPSIDWQIVASPTTSGAAFVSSPKAVAPMAINAGAISAAARRICRRTLSGRSCAPRIHLIVVSRFVQQPRDAHMQRSRILQRNLLLCIATGIAAAASGPAAGESYNVWMGTIAQGGLVNYGPAAPATFDFTGGI